MEEQDKQKELEELQKREEQRQKNLNDFFEKKRLKEKWETIKNQSGKMF